MTFLNLYVNFIRIAMIVLSAYYIYKKEYKQMKATMIVFVLTFFIALLNVILNIKLDRVGSFLYFTIITMTVYLGSALKFYDRYAWWDILVHFMSGITFVSLGIAVARKVEGLSNFSILFFSLTLSITLHAIWEVAEYTADSLFRSNHQRWQKHYDSINHKPEKAIQPAGLVDTMSDTITCIFGTVFSCFIWWFFL